ncbi:MAG: rubrerythrin family protein [Magnetococcales bacterium]|nr:rubrerythrin family protein [Magnetococcales bacterium]
MKTKENLKAAFAGESQANRKYLAFAKKADQEGFPTIASLFRAIAEAETIHAHTHLRNLGGIDTTLANLKEAMAGEDYEVTQMYPGMVAAAEAEGEKKAAQGMRHALEVEKVHRDLYQQAITALEQGKDLDHEALHVCGVCGHTVFGTPPDKCPVCGAKQSAYAKIA